MIVRVSNTDADKAMQLRKHKMMATGLFLLMLFVYIGCILLFKTNAPAWLGYVIAFAEAGMVGALADWFAVTALFHHPLGIPVPHTNLIENSRKKIGSNLGSFVVDNFLTPDTIRPYIQKLQFSSYAVFWLSKEANIDSMVREISWLLKDIIQNADEKTILDYISKKSKELLNDLKLNEALASGMQIIMERGDHERLLNFVLKKIKEYVANNEEIVRKKVKEESYFLIPGFVDNMIATKITKGIAKYLDEIEQNPQHKIRNDFNNQLHLFISDIRSNSSWQQNAIDVKNGLLTSNRIRQYASSVWKAFSSGMMHDLSVPGSAVQQYIKKTVVGMVQNLQEDAGLRNKIDQWIRHTAYRYILRNREEVGNLISNTIGNWESKQLSNKLELEVGKDLQFIRINGTLVGGLVGLIIYAITKFLE